MNCPNCGLVRYYDGMPVDAPRCTPKDCDLWTDWWIWVCDDERGWLTRGSISGPLTADEAIQSAIRHEQGPRWAFALSKGPNGSYYDLHYPEGVERTWPSVGRIGPSGYVAVAP